MKKHPTLSGPIIDRMPNSKAIFGDIKYWQVCVVSRIVNWNSHFGSGNFYQIYQYTYLTKLYYILKSSPSL